MGTFHKIIRLLSFKQKTTTVGDHMSPETRKKNWFEVWTETRTNISVDKINWTFCEDAETLDDFIDFSNYGKIDKSNSKIKMNQKHERYWILTKNIEKIRVYMIEWDHSQRKKLVIYSGKKQSTSLIKS